MRWPAKWKPRTVEQPLSITDWLPTLCGLAGAPLPDIARDGADITPLLSGGGAQETHPVYSAAPGFRARMVRHGAWKLIVSSRGGAEQRELYHVRDDISETKNLFGAEPAKAKELGALLAEFAAGDKAGKGE